MIFKDIESNTQFRIVGMEDILWQKQPDGTIIAIQPTDYEYSITPTTEISIIKEKEELNESKRICRSR